MKVLSLIGMAALLCAEPMSISLSLEGVSMTLASAHAAELPVERRAARPVHRRGYVAYASRSYDAYCDGPYVGGGWMGGTYYGGPFIDLRCLRPTY